MQAQLQVALFRRLSAGERDALRDEGAALLLLMAGAAERHDIDLQVG